MRNELEKRAWLLFMSGIAFPFFSSLSSLNFKNVYVWKVRHYAVERLQRGVNVNPRNGREKKFVINCKTRFMTSSLSLQWEALVNTVGN